MTYKLSSWVEFSRKQRFTLAIYLLLFYLLTLFVEFTKDALWQLSLWLIVLLLIEFLIVKVDVKLEEELRSEGNKPFDKSLEGK